ncbi:SCO2525 family SAM-dependent methyltransferase [Streptomyces sp. 3213.3]|uniref:SCO2525 family SAM-dependent methyltransferase n=1 Tax=Streptomyces sp. 3213.3 TaxID=1855348 RepID=UPI000B803910|nr:SCO2525 family SAM-dependent methyltransferase [Streptomyces sp. 3213.3]
MPSGSLEDLPQLNADVPWDEFNPADYISHNYRTVHPVDAEIIAIVRDHFSDHFRRFPGRPVRGIDVGAGANLYPALAMLPWCEEITLLDRSKRNVGYLRDQLDSYDAHWDAFWYELRKNGRYVAYSCDPRERFRQIVRVEQGDLFDMAEREGRWTLGTMFFVAESLSTSEIEFRQAVECFFHYLEPGAPFAAAFMEESVGYEVGGRYFPACKVRRDQIHSTLKSHTRELRTIPVGEQDQDKVRDGYTSMIVAYGFRRT